MLSLKTILAPVDFSQRTEVEAKNAADIAKRFGSRLILLHVIPRFADTYPADPTAAQAYSRQFSAEVEQGVDRALQLLASRVAPGVEVECVALSGEPAEMIEEFAVSREIDLVVMPTAGRGRIRRHLLGSVTTRMLHDLKCPVLTGVHMQECEQGGKALYKKIACKVEPGEDGAAQLRWARDFAAGYDAALCIVCVLPFLDTTGSTASLPEPLRERAITETKEKLEALSKQEGVDAEVTVLGGAIDQVLAPFVRANHVDLVVSGRCRQQDTMGVFGLHTDIVDSVKCLPCPVALV